MYFVCKVMSILCAFVLPASQHCFNHKSIVLIDVMCKIQQSEWCRYTKQISQDLSWRRRQVKVERMVSLMRLYVWVYIYVACWCNLVCCSFIWCSHTLSRCKSCSPFCQVKVSRNKLWVQMLVLCLRHFSVSLFVALNN